MIDRLEVHFEGKLVGNILYCAFVLLDEEDIIGSGMEEFNVSARLKRDEIEFNKNPKYKKMNNYHEALTAFYVMVKNLKNYVDELNEYDEVSYCNQNQLIFNWVYDTTKSVHESYEKVVNNVRKELYELNQLLMNDIVHKVKTIKGNKNMAKKHLTKRLEVVGNSKNEFVVDINKFKSEEHYEVGNVYNDSLLKIIDFEED